ncbi:hypothetical protein K503DRAFT_863141 [Rhizopogon vinicolor AM-OR11-026]|uniref:F-box domain-containing protein n=1 Tax=Rhizopogon vinicolor AM-OR11-026 TaxID=1314800 RepID=A0A1B7NBP9_9AGAM|nr:hypothetical protein K503DRAFT_863141 [Rhizopogon vinicolor AM-OR11-026]
MSAITMVRLPPELWCHILAFLDVYGLLQVRKTCKALKGMVDNSEILQYIIDLRYFRMIEAVGTYETNVPPVAARRKRLRQHEAAWQRIEYQRKYTVPLTIPGDRDRFTCDVFGAAGRDVIYFVRLPPTLESDPDLVRSWSHSIDVATMIDFTFCPEQDLLIVVASAPDNLTHVDIHLRSLTTNETHPDAAQPILKAFDINCVFLGGLRISGNYICFLCLDTIADDRIIGDCMQMWDWKSENDYQFTLFFEEGVNDYTFLAEDKFLVATCGTIEIYSFADKSKPPQCTSKVSLPSLMDRWVYRPVSEARITACNLVFPYQPSSFFYPSPDDELVVISVSVHPVSVMNETTPHFRFFVARRSAILQLENLYAKTYGQPTSNGPKLLWSTWGPQHTTWFGDWEQSACGFRTARSINITPDHMSNELRRLCIRDFNPHTASNYGVEDTTGWHGSQLVQGELTTEICYPFTEPLGSALSYRETVSEELFDVTETLVDDSRILLLKRDDAGSLQKIDILMF